YAETRACWMASMTISRGTPFSAASCVMAVTNSLFMFLGLPSATCKSTVAYLWPRQQKKWGLPTSSSVGTDGSASSRAERQYITAPAYWAPNVNDFNGRTGGARQRRFDKAGSAGLAKAGAGLGGGILPLAVASDEGNQPLVGVGFGHSLFNDLFADVQVDAP